ncbi:unnamed protein product [Calypogeia fissa]
MIVQERGDGIRKTKYIGEELRTLVGAESGDESEKDAEQQQLEPVRRTKSNKSEAKQSWLDYLGCFAWCDNLLKLVILVLIVSSIGVLAFFRNREENTALICIEEIPKIQAIPYPNLDLKHVKKVKDYTRYVGVTADKWIVLTVSGPPTPEVEAFSNLKGWQVLAVGTADAPADWRVANVVFLSFDLQAELPYRINQFLPRNSYIRKNVGYLFAIQHGAKKIYDADENASLFKEKLEDVFDVELLGSQAPVLQYRYFDTRKVVNPFVHFGQRSVWPRGLPLEAVSEISPEVMYAQVTRGKQYIQQSLANGLPDVDSVFYYTRKSQVAPLDLTFDSFAPPVMLPQGLMAPINALNTLFHATSFWALLLPVTVETKTSDIIRGYVGQRLLWEVGGMLGVYPPMISRKDTLQAPPFEEEKDLHAKVQPLISYLLKWRSHKPSLFEKILHLSYSLAEAGFLDGQDVELTAAWLQDLVSVGYSQPRLMALELDRNRTSWTSLGHEQFLPHAFAAPYLGLEDMTGMASQMTDLIRWRHFFGNIVLVLECVGPYDHTVLGWRMFYGRLFKHIVVLGPQADEGLGVEAVTDQSYKMLTDIFDRYSNADGFLMIKDTVVLNYWNLLLANKSELWNVHKVSEAWQQFDVTDNGTATSFESPEMKKSFTQAFKSLPPDFRKAYRKSIGETFYVMSPSDVFYVPKRYVTNFITLITPMSQAGLPQELAIPMIFLALDKPENYESSALSNMIYIDEKRLKKLGGDRALFYKSDVDAVCPWRATSEDELAQLFKTIGKNDLHLLDAFD